MLRILVGVNQSEESQLALRYACHLLEHFPARVDALYVKPDVVEMAREGAYAPFTTRSGIEREVEREAAKVVEGIFEACSVCLGGKVPCNPRVAVGDPAEEILHMADEGQYDLIVLGGPSRSTLRGLLLGAVHNTRCFSSPGNPFSLCAITGRSNAFWWPTGAPRATRGPWNL